VAVAVAASQGLISYDAKLADYWTEFAQADKGAVTVRQLLSHQAGLPARQARLLATHGGPGAWCPSTSRRHALGRPITRPKNRD
jgi:CubicO group peptidase (beta-lactamase class C family)